MDTWQCQVLPPNLEYLQSRMLTKDRKLSPTATFQPQLKLQGFNLLSVSIALVTLLAVRFALEDCIEKFSINVATHRCCKL